MVKFKKENKKEKKNGVFRKYFHLIPLYFNLFLSITPLFLGNAETLNLTKQWMMHFLSLTDR